MNDKLLGHHAVVDSIVIDEATLNSEVERKIAYFQNQLGTKQKMLDYFGFNNVADIKKELFTVEKESALTQRMQSKITAGTDVTPEEVTSFFKSLEAENNIPEFGADIELGQIVIEAKADKDEEAKVIAKLNQYKKEIEDGASFSLKAILYSQDPTASKEGKGKGGLYKGITKETGFVKEFKEVVFSLEEGEISEPFKTQFGFHIIRLEKINGKARDLRHILLQTNITDEALDKVKAEIEKVRDDILTDKITFEEAVMKYSSDKQTNKNKGLLINPMSNDTHFDLTKMDPAIYARISKLKEGELSVVFYDETREGEKMFKFMLVKSKNDTHIANLDGDYVKIKRMALQKKKSELVEKWSKDKMSDTYVKIHNEYKKCTFEYNWSKD